MKAKKVWSIVAVAALTVSLVAGCGNNQKGDNGEKTSKKDDKTIVVGASPAPHAEILNHAKKAMKDKGYNLVVKEMSDYVIPNTAVEEGDLDANYFQHITYLNNFNEEKGTHLVNAGEIHYEPFGIYPGNAKSIKDLKKGAKIAVPNDTTNEARALLLLQENNIITLKKDAGLTASKNDIEKNPNEIEIVELEAAQIPRSIKDVDLAVINGNYALDAGFNVEKDALAIEDASSDAVKAYVNIIAVKDGKEKSDAVKALVDVLKSDDVKKFIKDKYKGAVVPME